VNIVISIGVINSCGNFENNNWATIIEWFSKICNNVRIYTKLHSKDIKKFFHTDWIIEEESFPDPTADMRGFRLWCQEDDAWGVFNVIPFDPESGISHFYTLNDDFYIGELSVSDGENFIVLKIDVYHEQQLLKLIPNIIENVKICSRWKEYITFMIEHEDWKPLGGFITSTLKLHDHKV
jgi:hypothetical protein